MFRLATLFTGLVVATFFMLASISPVFAADPITPGLCAGANLEVSTDCNTGLTDAEASEKINKLIKTVISLFSLVVGVVSVIMIIYGGLRYITSGGNDTSVTGAKNTILYAVIGLVIVALAQVMVRFILGKVTQT